MKTETKHPAEHFEHDNCPECGTNSVPFEGVPDQALRGCPKCEHQWCEDLNSAPKTTPSRFGGGLSTDPKESDWVEEVGEPAYAAIAEMVAALQCDYARLEELKDWRGDWEPESEGPKTWEEACPEDAAELAELEAAGQLDGEEMSEEDARERIQEDALSLRIFGERTDGEWEADRFELLLTTGGPAVRIMGELDDNNEPDRAWLEVQDWGTPWTQYFAADRDVLMAYAGCFCFE